MKTIDPLWRRQSRNWEESIRFQLQNIMLLKKVSRADLARRMGVSRGRVTKLLEESRPGKTLDTVYHVSAALNVTPVLVFRDND